MVILIKAHELKIGDIFYIQNSEKLYKVQYNNKSKVQYCILGDEENTDSYLWIQGYTDVHMKVGGNSNINFLSEKVVEILYQNNILNDVLTAMDDYHIIKSKVSDIVGNSIFKETLASALSIAINKKEVEEYHMGYSRNSAMLANWKECYDTLKNGKNIITK